MPSFDHAAAKAAGYSDDEINAFLGQASTPPRAAPSPAPTQYDPTEGMSGAERVLAGIGGGMTDVYLGGKQLLSHVFSGIDQDALRAAIEEKRRLDAPLMNTTGGKIGSIIGEIAATAPLMLIPGAATIRGGAAIGAAAGALRPTGEKDNATAQVLEGTVGGAIGGAASRVLGRVLAPETSEAVRDMARSGVRMTPGQLMGPAANRIESGLSSFPVVGDIVGAGRSRAIEDFNRSLVDKSLANIGEKLPATARTGHEAVQHAQDAVSGAYDQLLPTLNIKMDSKLFSNINDIRTNLRAAVPPDRLDQFDRLIDYHFLGRFNPAQNAQGWTVQRLTGEEMKNAESQLRTFAKSLMSGDPDSRQVGMALRDLQSEIRRTLIRQSPTPEAAKRLTDIDRAYSSLTKIERAAAKSDSGVFSPKQYATEARRAAGTKKAARGAGQEQQFAENARHVLGNPVSDSGTPFRIATMMGLGGAGAATGMIPQLIAMGVLAPAAYSNMGRGALTALATKRPDSVRAMGEAIKRGVPMSALLGSEAFE